MNNRIVIIIFHVLLVSQVFSGENFARWTRTELIFNNGSVQRTIRIPDEKGNFLTTRYAPMAGDFRYFQPENVDFQFTVDGTVYSGKSNWQLEAIETIADSLQGNGAAVTLASSDKKLELTLNYLLYPKLPVIRKNLVIKNLGSAAFALESVDVEKFSVVTYTPTTFSWIYSDYGRRKSIGPYEGNMQDALIIVHDPDRSLGMVIGNEASGVMKRTAVFWDEAGISSGLTHSNSRFPFRKWLEPGESFVTPQIFTMVYNNHRDAMEILNTDIPDFVRKHMGIRLAALKEKPTFMYNTWHPFRKNINEKLVMELAEAAAEAGIKEFIIDDGWQDNYGDWGIDYQKFPNGLKSVFDYIKSLGMKPGLWVSVGSASPESRVYHEHPEWFIRNQNGEFSNIHTERDDGIRSACYSTGWKDYIKNILMKLAVDYGLEYLKLDFAVVTSAYVFDHEKSGCYATDHAGHKDHSASLYANYERMWELFDELHDAKPDLFIDCTFEAMGGLQLIDYAMLKHAEGNWLSNFQGENELGDLRIRNMAWWRSPAIPATALVIGNPRMDDAGWENHIKSSAGALPIMLGDPRRLSPAEVKKYRTFADWLQTMQTRYDVMSFRQDLPGFGEPQEGMWDGFQRLNTETKNGGMVAVFRHGAVEAKRIITVKYLDPAEQYTVISMEGKTIVTKTGKELEATGFNVAIPELYGGEWFEIRPCNQCQAQGRAR